MDARIDTLLGPVSVRRARSADRNGIAALGGGGDAAAARWASPARGLGLDVSSTRSGDGTGPPLGGAWVAADAGQVVGMIVVERQRAEVARIRGPRLASAWASCDLGPWLLQAAGRYCRDAGYVKATVDAGFEPHAVVRAMERAPLRWSRTRRAGRGYAVEFYTDLYESRPGQGDDRVGPDGPGMGVERIDPALGPSTGEGLAARSASAPAASIRRYRRRYRSLTNS